MFDISRYKDLEYVIIQEARKDSAFKAELIKQGNSKNAIESRFKISLPEKVNINVIEDKKDKFTIVLPPEDSDKILGNVKGGMYW